MPVGTRASPAKEDGAFPPSPSSSSRTTSSKKSSKQKATAVKKRQPNPKIKAKGKKVSAGDGGGEGKRKRGDGFSRDEIDYMLDCIAELLPIGMDEWELVERKHNQRFPGRAFADSAFD